MTTHEEKFIVARERFITSSKQSNEELEAAIQLNQELHTHTYSEMFRRFTI